MKCKIERTTDFDGPVSKTTVFHCSLCERWLSLVRHFPFKDAIKFGKKYGWFVRRDIIICPYCLNKFWKFAKKNIKGNSDIQWFPTEYNQYDLIKKIVGESK